MGLVLVCFWASLIIVLCGLLSTGKQSIGKLCRMSGHPLFQKAWTFWLGPPPPPRISITDFNIRCPSHNKQLYGSFGWRKRPDSFLTEGIWQRKPRFNKQGLYACFWTGHLFILNTMLVSNHLMDTESSFAPWDPSKAHILVSTPVYV